MRKFVIYQTDKNIGIVPREEWECFEFENEIKPTRLCVCSITKQGILALVDILQTDKDLFIDVVTEELNKNPFTIYSS